MKNFLKKLWVAAGLAAMTIGLAGCGGSGGGSTPKAEFSAKNNTAAITRSVHYSAAEVKNALTGTLWECKVFEDQPARNYCFFEDGSFLLNYLGCAPAQLYRVGDKNALYEAYGSWEYDEPSETVTVSCEGYDNAYKLWLYDGQTWLIDADWHPEYEGKYSFMAEEDKDFEYDNTPYEPVTPAAEGSELLFACPEGAGVKDELVGIWSTDTDNLSLAHILLLKSDGTLYFSVNLGGSNVTHKGLWAEKEGKLYLTYFDEYSGDSFDTLTQAVCWFAFDYSFENEVLRCEDVFFDNDYFFYADESQAAL